MPTRKIKFSKYQCPFNELVIGYEADSDTNKYGIINLEEEGFEEQPNFKKGPPLGPAVICDFGILPINERTLTSKQFNLWLMDTNFTIGPEMADCIEDCPGVETLDLITRYKCRIGFGAMFEPGDVKATLQKLLCEEPKKPKINAIAYEAIKKFFGGKYPYYAIITTKGNMIVPFGAEKQEEVEQRINQEKNVKEVIRSWECQTTNS